MTQRKKRWGDRWDAYRLRGLDPLHTMMPYMFRRRTDNEAVLGEVMDLTEVDRYLAGKNAGNPEFKYTWFHFITAAIAKTIYLRPKMNYFISGGHYFERDSIQIAFNVKRKFTDEAEESMAKFVLNPDGEAPIEQVHTYVHKLVTKVRSEHQAIGVDNVLEFVKHFPRPAFKLMMWGLRTMEYFGIYPKGLAAGDPSYSSAYLTNLGSIKMNADYHHLFDWGTVSLFVTIGEAKKIPFFNEDGTFQMKNTIKLGLTIDERIADGYYFAKTMRLLRKIFQNPELLDLPASTPIEID